MTLPEGEKLSILQRTRYPWDGNVIIEVLDNCTFTLNIRIPHWCEKNTEININGDTYSETATPGTYVKIARSWSIGDSICIQFAMPVRIIKAHPYVRENNGMVALMRGPLLFCLEAVDHPDVNLMDIVVEPGQHFTSSFQPDMLQGIQIIEASVKVRNNENAWQHALYREKSKITSPNTESVELKAIPYFAWGNRVPGQMLVWLQDSLKETELD